jgi:hypothetical protein
MMRGLAVAITLSLTLGCGFSAGDGNKSSSGSGIDADAAVLDGNRHPIADGQGDADIAIRGEDAPVLDTADAVAEVAADGPADLETETPAHDTADQVDGLSCTPNCAGKECGDDGCGLSCGQCVQGSPFCVDGVCADCMPDCVGKLCGDDLCGGTCGICFQGWPCVEGMCVCAPLCDAVTCEGPDGCGGTCPPCTGTSDVDASPDVADSTLDPDPDPEVIDSGPADVVDTNVGPDAPADVEVVADVPVPDVPVPDVPAPDVPVPDVPAPDVAAPDVADTVEDADTQPPPDVPDAEPADADADAAPEVVLPPSPPAPTELVLAEIMRAPLDGAGPGRQWLELASIVEDPREIGGCQIIDAAGTSWTIPDSLVTEPYARLVFGEEGDVTDGLIATDGTYPTVEAGGPDLAIEGTITFLCPTGIIDTVNTAAVGPTGSFPDQEGHAMQLAPGFTTAGENDAPAAWCTALTSYGVAGFGSPGQTNHPCKPNVDWCRLWSPAFQLSDAGVPWEATGHLHQDGLTNITPNAPDSAPGLMAQVGYGPDGLDPLVAPAEWIWFTAVAVEDPPPEVPSSDDRYTGAITVSDPGVYDVAARFSLDGGYTWTVCDLDGSSDGYELANTGHATIL